MLRTATGSYTQYLWLLHYLVVAVDSASNSENVPGKLVYYTTYFNTRY